MIGLAKEEVRSFLGRMIGLAKVAIKVHHYIQQNLNFKSDVQGWACFLPDWNGICTCMMSGMTQHHYLGLIMSATSGTGTWGYGVYCLVGD